MARLCFSGSSGCLLALSSVFCGCLKPPTGKVGEPIGTPSRSSGQAESGQGLRAGKGGRAAIRATLTGTDPVGSRRERTGRETREEKTFWIKGESGCRSCHFTAQTNQSLSSWPMDRGQGLGWWWLEAVGGRRRGKEDTRPNRATPVIRQRPIARLLSLTYSCQAQEEPA